MKLAIIKYCQIKDKSLLVNGEEIFQNKDAETEQEFLNAAYRETKVGYPKFFKMDSLSKTGFLSAELLLKGTAVYGDEPKINSGIFISNRSSSLETDEAYQHTIGDEYFPSPAVFVYTLPNIVMGEIAIKHKFFGENTFFVSEKFDSQSVVDYVTQSFKETEMNTAIVGWVDFHRQRCESFLMLVEKLDAENNSELEFSEEQIVKLYK